MHQAGEDDAAVESIRVRETEHDAVDALIAAAGLPLDDIERCRAHQFVIRDRRGLAATAALEVHGSDAVLRSVAVAAERRGEGLGDAIVRAALEEARATGVATVFLLTETAPDFFRRFGFEVVERAAAPPAIRNSVEYCSVCPATATAMRLNIRGEIS